VLASALGLWSLTSYATYWIDTSSGKARLIKGTVDVQRGDRAEGVALVREAQEREPGDWSSRVMLADYLLQAGAPRSGIERLLAPDVHVPELAVRHLALARLAFQDGDMFRVESELRRAVAVDPDSLAAHAKLAALAAQGGDVEGAVRELREALRIDPQHQISHVVLSGLYARLGDPQRGAMHQTYAARLEAGK
jgi:Flp pilus assembly protein TadD